jgi:UPF0755 protein
VFLVVALVLAGLAVTGLRYVNGCKNGSGAHDAAKVTIPEGSSSGDVVTILHEAGVMRCGGLIGRFLIRNDDRAGSIRAGSYTLRTNMTVDQILDVITAKPKPVQTTEFDIPTGFRLTQIAATVGDTPELGVTAKEFLAVAHSGKLSLPPYFSKGTKNPEGFFWPRRYRVAVKTATAVSLVHDMLNEFRTGVADLPWKNAKQLGMTPYRIVVIASMIERETGLDGDRPKVAEVIYNRLHDNVALGIDATLLYDDPTPGDHTLTAKDLQSDSPYNTRVHKGLPPTPIASPSLASIQAALQPAHGNYLYYVKCDRDGAGKSRFASTYDEFLHDKNVCLGG